MSKVTLLDSVFYFMCKLLHVKRVWANLVEILYSVFLYERVILYMVMLHASQCICVCVGDARCTQPVVTANARFCFLIPLSHKNLCQLLLSENKCNQHETLVQCQRAQWS